MKCPACGREMSNKGTYFDCPNVLCDYEEEIEKNDGAKISALLLRQPVSIMADAINR